MIHHSLQCTKGHVFGEWFASMADYDERVEASDLACPECGDVHVEKALMAPNLASGSTGDAMTACEGGEGPSCATCPMAESA